MVKLQLSVGSVRRSLSERLRARVDRLRHITGFVTTFDEEHDRRTAVFARLWHVERVAATARKLSGLSGNVDPDDAERLAWIHDLNRWPFAHNSERGHFDQVTSLERYFAEDREVSDKDVADLKGINLKDPESISDTAKVVLLADTVTGIVEDPLLAVVGLNLHPRLIPEEIDDMLGYSLNNGPYTRQCQDLAARFRSPSASPQEFNDEFQDLFWVLLERFLDSNADGDFWAGYERLLNISKVIKVTFMRPVVFPINNEGVCHAELLREKVIPWYLEHCGDSERLLEIDEPTFVEEVTSAPDSPFRPEQFWPDLDAVRSHMAEKAFIR